MTADWLKTAVTAAAQSHPWTSHPRYRGPWSHQTHLPPRSPKHCLSCELSMTFHGRTAFNDRELHYRQKPSVEQSATAIVSDSADYRPTRWSNSTIIITTQNDTQPTMSKHWRHRDSIKDNEDLFNHKKQHAINSVVLACLVSHLH